MAKKKWLQKATKKMEKKGTVGSFTAWCKRQGFDGVTDECIAKGLQSKDPAIRKKAHFARNARKAARGRRRSS